MVTVSSYAVRQNKDGESFVVLQLQGDLELVKSQVTGNFYATAKKCTISSTFNEQVAASLVGKQIPGKIVKQQCEPYEFVVPDTAESVILNYRWTYVPEEAKVQKHNEIIFSQNGSLVEA
jgi:hypothetical protein